MADAQKTKNWLIGGNCDRKYFSVRRQSCQPTHLHKGCHHTRVLLTLHHGDCARSDALGRQGWAGAAAAGLEMEVGLSPRHLQRSRRGGHSGPMDGRCLTQPPSRNPRPQRAPAPPAVGLEEPGVNIGNRSGVLASGEANQHTWLGPSRARGTSTLCIEIRSPLTCNCNLLKDVVVMSVQSFYCGTFWGRHIHIHVTDAKVTSGPTNPTAEVRLGQPKSEDSGFLALGCTGGGLAAGVDAGVQTL